MISGPQEQRAQFLDQTTVGRSVELIHSAYSNSQPPMAGEKRTEIQAFACWLGQRYLALTEQNQGALVICIDHAGLICKCGKELHIALLRVKV